MSRFRTVSAILLAAAWFGVACGSNSTLLGGAAGVGNGDGGPDAGNGAGGTLIGTGADGSGANGSGAADNAGDGSGASSATGNAGGSANAGGSSSAGASASGGNGTGGTGSKCGAFNEPCKAGGDCCSGVCDAKSNSCTSVLTTCGATNDACTVATDCCGLRCENKKCAAAACVSDGQKCTSNTQCCGGQCTSGTCAPLNTTCATSGNTCKADTDCCSKSCDNGKCTLGVSYCIQPGDVCARDQDCCTASCTIAAGKTIGTCDAPPAGPAFCTGVDGVVCGGCGDCCSRLCAPFGPTGTKICQPASGCHITGDLCRKNSDCCGGTEDTTLPGYGNVTCDVPAGKTVGICRNPSNGPGPGGACNPQGNVCHFQDYACSISSARADCCGGLGAKGGVCELDGLGVPRCNGLSACRPGGETCASAADCCDDVPCIPDAQGVLRCLTPGTGPTCSVAGGSCTINGDCCVGTLCTHPVGSTLGTCTDTPTGGSGGMPGTGGGTSTGGSAGKGGTTGSGGTGGSGGSAGTPACGEYGQQCKVNGDCCNAVPCDGGICRFPAG